MEVILKSTLLCNFRCTFCSAASIKSLKVYSKPNKKLLDKIKEFNPTELIITGGEPLCNEPSFYFDLLNELPNCFFSMTSNLKNFYLNPEKWIPLFKHKRFGVTTSFNFGKTRLWDAKTVYTKDMFLKVMTLFNDKIGYTPYFIAVIDNDNEDTVLDTVRLAKSLNTKCRINGASCLGIQRFDYPRYKTFRNWISIINNGLEDYEINISERKDGKCPLNTSCCCQDHIRAIYIDDNEDLHIENCEDKFSIQEKDASVISNKCYSCDLFRICNSCNTNRASAKLHNEYCEEMLKLKDDIIKYGWKY